MKYLLTTLMVLGTLFMIDANQPGVAVSLPPIPPCLPPECPFKAVPDLKYKEQQVYYDAKTHEYFIIDKLGAAQVVPLEK